jgi:hypothetical protein
MSNSKEVTVTVSDSTKHKRYDVAANYVPALKDPAPRIEILPPVELPPMLPTAQTSVELKTTYTDRAKGFQVATVPIAIAFGVGTLIVAIVGYSVPMFSLGALAVFWIAFLGWWLIGWTIHHVASPDGIALVQALLMYKYVRNEQRERHRRYRWLHDEKDTHRE